MLRRAILSTVCAAGGDRRRRDVGFSGNLQVPARRRQFHLRPGSQHQRPGPDDVRHDLDAQHRHEHVRIADDARREFQPDPGARQFDGGVAGSSDLHVQAAPGRPLPQRQGDDLGRCRRLVRPLRQGRPLSQHARQRRSLGCAGQGHVRDPPEEGAADLPGDPQRVQRADRHHPGRGQGRSADAAQDRSAPGRGSWSSRCRAATSR